MIDGLFTREEQADEPPVLQGRGLAQEKNGLAPKETASKDEVEALLPSSAGVVPSCQEVEDLLGPDSDDDAGDADFGRGGTSVAVENNSSSSGDVDKIVSFVKEQQQAGGVSLNFLNAYFNSDLEDNWFKFSLADNVRAALASGRLLRRSRGGEDFFFVTKTMSDSCSPSGGTPKENSQTLSGKSAASGRLKRKPSSQSSVEKLSVGTRLGEATKRRSLPGADKSEDEPRAKRGQTNQLSTLTAVARRQSRESGKDNSPLISMRRRKSQRFSQASDTKQQTESPAVGEVLNQNIRDVLKCLPQGIPDDSDVDVHCQDMVLTEQQAVVAVASPEDKKLIKLERFERFDSDSDSDDLDLQKKIDTILLHDESSVEGPPPPDKIKKQHPEDEVETAEVDSVVEDLQPRTESKLGDFDDLDSIAVDLSLMMDAPPPMTTALSMSREEFLVTPEVPCMGDEVLPKVFGSADTVPPSSLSTVVSSCLVDSLARDVYGLASPAKSLLSPPVGQVDRVKSGLDQMCTLPAESQEEGQTEKRVNELESSKDLVESKEVSTADREEENRPSNQIADHKEKSVTITSGLLVPVEQSSEVRAQAPSLTEPTADLPHKEQRKVAKKLPIYRTALPVQVAFPKKGTESNQLPAENLEYGDHAVASKAIKLGNKNTTTPKTTTTKTAALEPAKRKLQQRKKFGSVNTSFRIETVNSYDLLEDTDDPYNVLEDFKEADKKEEKALVVMPDKKAVNSQMNSKFNSIFDKVIQDGLERMTQVYLKVKSQQGLAEKIASPVVLASTSKLPLTVSTVASHQDIKSDRPEQPIASRRDALSNRADPLPVDSSAESVDDRSLMRDDKGASYVPPEQVSSLSGVDSKPTYTNTVPIVQLGNQNVVEHLNVVSSDINCESESQAIATPEACSVVPLAMSSSFKAGRRQKRPIEPPEEAQAVRVKRGRKDDSVRKNLTLAEKRGNPASSSKADATSQELDAAKETAGHKKKFKSVSAKTLKHLEKMRARKQELKLLKINPTYSLSLLGPSDQLGNSNILEASALKKVARTGSASEVDYHHLCMEAIERLNEPSGSSLKAIKRYIMEVHKTPVKNQLIILNLESAAVAGELTRLEKGGSSFYRLTKSPNKEDPADILDQSEAAEDKYEMIKLWPETTAEEPDELEPVAEVPVKDLNPVCSVLEYPRKDDVSEEELEVNPPQDCSGLEDEGLTCAQETFSPTCPLCFRFLPNREKMVLHILTQHPEDPNAGNLEESVRNTVPVPCVNAGNPMPTDADRVKLSQDASNNSMQSKIERKDAELNTMPLDPDIGNKLLGAEEPQYAGSSTTPQDAVQNIAPDEELAASLFVPSSCQASPMVSEVAPFTFSEEKRAASSIPEVHQSSDEERPADGHEKTCLTSVESSSSCSERPSTPVYEVITFVSQNSKSKSHSRERTPVPEVTRVSLHERSLSREVTPSLERTGAASRERTPISLDRPASALSVSSCLSSVDSQNPSGGIKLRISFRSSGSHHVTTDESSSSSILRVQEGGGESSRRRRLYEEDEEEGRKMKKRRPRENIPQRSDMLHSITRDIQAVGSFFLPKKICWATLSTGVFLNQRVFVPKTEKTLEKKITQSRKFL